MISRAISRVALDTPTYAAGIIEAIIGSDSMILFIVLVNRTTSYYRA